MTTTIDTQQPTAIDNNAVAFGFPQAEFTQGLSDGEKAADSMVNLLRAGVKSGSHGIRDESNPAMDGYAGMIAEQMRKLEPQDQSDFLERLVEMNTNGDLDKQIGPSNFNLGSALGAAQAQHPEQGEKIGNHLKTLFESGEISPEDVKTLYKDINENQNSVGDFRNGSNPAEGMREIAQNVGNREFSDSAMQGLIDSQPKGRDADNVYNAALGMARDTANAGMPDAALELVDKLYQDPDMRDDMFKQLDENGGTDGGRSGMLSLVNDLDKQNKELGNIDKHFGGIDAAEDRLENIWQGAHKHIAGDENAVRESNEYFQNNIQRLNNESRNIAGDNITENDDNTLITDYVQNVLLDETVDGEKVGRKEALQSIVNERDRLMNTINDSDDQGARETAAGDLGNLVGSVGAGMDKKFRGDVKDAEDAAGWAATMGGAIVDSIPVVGPLAEKAGGDLLQNATREAIKKTIEDGLTEGTKPDEAPLFEEMKQNMARQLPDPSNPRLDKEQNELNQDIRDEFDVSVMKHEVEALNAHVDD